MTKKIVVIGGVAAGPKAACHLKRLQPGWDITVVDQDNLISYGGCGIPYYVSGDVSDESELRSTSFHMVRDVPFFERAKGLKVLTSTRALAIDRQNTGCPMINLCLPPELNPLSCRLPGLSWTGCSPLPICIRP